MDHCSLYLLCGHIEHKYVLTITVLNFNCLKGQAALKFECCLRFNKSNLVTQPAMLTLNDIRSLHIISGKLDEDLDENEPSLQLHK